MTNINPGLGSKKSHVGAAAADLLHEGKKFANEVYEEGMTKVTEAEDHVKEYSDQLLKKVEENPLSAVLIAAGIGFLISKIFQK